MTSDCVIPGETWCIFSPVTHPKSETAKANMIKCFITDLVLPTRSVGGVDEMRGAGASACAMRDEVAQILREWKSA